MEWFRGECIDLGESGVIQGRVEWFRGEWSDLGERGVVDPERLAETGHRSSGCHLGLQTEINKLSWFT